MSDSHPKTTLYEEGQRVMRARVAAYIRATADNFPDRAEKIETLANVVLQIPIMPLRSEPTP